MLVQKTLKSNLKALGTGLVLMLLSITTFAQVGGNGNVGTENRVPTDYKKVLIKLPCDVELVCQSSPNITITAEENLLSYITTDVVEGRLVISSTKTLLPTVRIKVYAQTNVLTEMETSTVGRNAYLARKLTGNDFRLMNIKGDVVLRGNIQTADLVVESGNVYAQHLNTENTIVQAWGGGTVASAVAGVGCGQLSNLSTFAFYGTPNLDRLIIQEGPATIIPAAEFPASELDARMEKVIDRVRGTSGGGNLAGKEILTAQKLELSKVEVELLNNGEDRVDIHLVGPSVKRFDYTVTIDAGASVTERLLPGTQVLLEKDGISTQKLLMISTDDESKTLALFNETRPQLLPQDGKGRR